jgi:hypothetical protein
VGMAMRDGYILLSICTNRCIAHSLSEGEKNTHNYLFRLKVDVVTTMNEGRT